MAIQNFAEYFGCDPAANNEAADMAEGYLTGTKYADWIRENLVELYGDRSRAYREAVLEALREQL